MRFTDSILSQLMKPLSRRSFEGIVARHDGDAYDKRFRSWNQLVTMIYAQLAGATSLRGLESLWNAGGGAHYHLGCGPIARSTLSDANNRRPPAIFTEAFSLLAGMADRHVKQQGRELVRLIDSTPVPLGEVIGWRRFNGRIKGMKLHVVYDPGMDVPRLCETTDANVNDIEMARGMEIEPGATYVMDKAYCHYGWWEEIGENKAFFVTRMKQRARFRSIGKRALKTTEGDGFTVIEDAEVKLVRKSRASLSIRMRRITIKRHGAGKLVLLTNDMRRSAVKIAALYKRRWQIELLFRWIKQHLNIKTFLGRSENAVRTQIMIAMIAYVLLRLAHHASRSALLPLRFADLAGRMLFLRKPLARLEHPPDPAANRPRNRPDASQLAFCYD